MTKVMMMLGPYPFMLDTAAYQQLKRSSEYRWKELDRLEDVIAANSGLAAYGPVLPSGLIIDLPDIADTAPERPTIRLWD